MATIQITESKLLVVEGRDAEKFFIALLQKMKLKGIQVIDFGSKDIFRRFLKALIITPGFRGHVTSLGIVRDAETDAHATFDSICGTLRHLKLPVPDAPETPSGANPIINTLILPDASTPGMLETMCLQMVADDPVMPCIDQYFDCVEQELGSLPRNMFKARLRVFLASRRKPHLLMANALRANYLPWDSPAIQHVRDFLQAL